MSGRTSQTQVVGSVREQDGRGVARMEDWFATDAADLWSALTDPERLRRWIADVEGDLRVGGAFTAAFTSSWNGPGRVDVCEPPRRLLVTTGEAGEETEIEAVLTPDGEGTRLVIEERGLPLAEVAAHGAGWQVHVEDLETYLAGGRPGEWRDRWQELRSSYQEPVPQQG